MFSYGFVGDDFVVQNQFYKLTLSAKYGGTIRELIHKNEDTGLTREGCEYWEPNGSDHYEQEFSPTAEIKILDKSSERVDVEVKARLVSPQLKKDGGSCVVTWTFRRNDPFIYSEYAITPLRLLSQIDRYICFKPKAYKKYHVIDQKENVTRNNMGREGWKIEIPASRWISVHNDRGAVALISTPTSKNGGVWKTESMIEIKVMEYERPRPPQKTGIHYLVFPIEEEQKYTRTIQHRIKDREFNRIHTQFLGERPKHEAHGFKHNPPEKARTNWLLSVLPTMIGERVLDLCGGYGTCGAYLRFINEAKFDYTCLDINKHRVNCGVNYFNAFNLNEARFVLHDINQPLPFESESFDMIWLFGWCDNPFDCPKLFKEIYRILTEEGTFIFNMAKLGTAYKTKHSEEGLREFLANVGFDIVLLESIDQLDYGIIVTKTPLKDNFIFSWGELQKLRETALSAIDGNDSSLQKGDKLSKLCKRSIEHLDPMPKNTRWYYASPVETLEWGIGNCKNYAELLIALSRAIGMGGRKIYIKGMVDDRRDRQQGHVICELKIDERWVVFDAMYGVPHLETAGRVLFNAYDCWKNPNLYRTLTNPNQLRYSKMFWRQIWNDFLIEARPTIRELGEKEFVEKWYGDSTEF